MRRDGKFTGLFKTPVALKYWEEAIVALPWLGPGSSGPGFGWKCSSNINVHLISKEQVLYACLFLANIWPIVSSCFPLCTILQIFIHKRTHLLFLRKTCSGLFCQCPNCFPASIYQTRIFVLLSFLRNSWVETNSILVLLPH